MLIRRSELRLALTAGLMNGLGSLAPLAYGFYAPLAVLVVCTGTYGGSIGLGRQRLLVVPAMLVLRLQTSMPQKALRFTINT